MSLLRSGRHSRYRDNPPAAKRLPTPFTKGIFIRGKPILSQRTKPTESQNGTIFQVDDPGAAHRAVASVAALLPAVALSAVLAVAFALASGLPVLVFAGASGVPVAGADSQPESALFPFVAGVFVLASGFAAPVVAAVAAVSAVVAARSP